MITDWCVEFGVSIGQPDLAEKVKGLAHALSQRPRNGLHHLEAAFVSLSIPTHSLGSTGPSWPGLIGGPV